MINDVFSEVSLYVNIRQVVPPTLYRLGEKHILYSNKYGNYNKIFFIIKLFLFTRLQNFYMSVLLIVITLHGSEWKMPPNRQGRLWFCCTSPEHLFVFLKIKYRSKRIPPALSSTYKKKCTFLKEERKANPEAALLSCVGAFIFIFGNQLRD